MLIASNLHEADPLVARERAAGEAVFVEKDDNSAIRRLADEAARYDLQSHGGKRLECYLILDNLTSLWLLQTVGIPQKVSEKVDVFATTVEDLLAKTIFVRLPGIPVMFPPLDRDVISRDSEMTVHLVLVGFSSQAEALAINAALVAHYPNYCRDNRLRTRITIIDDNVYIGKERMVQRYVHLFDNSYYRTIDLNDVNPQCVVHRPVYESKRKDFVDVEWEFVNGNIRNDAVRQKLSEWSGDKRQQLTICLCHADCNRNFNEAFALPQVVYEMQVPILCHAEGYDTLFSFVHPNIAYSSIYTFGKSHCTIEILRILKALAQRVNYVYNHCFSLTSDDPVTAPSSIDINVMESQWKQISSLPKQYSNIFNAMTLGTKMHSIGHGADNWKEYYALTLEEINMLTEVEHNRWSVEELILGYRPVTEEERRFVEDDISQKKTLRDRKVHYDLRAFEDLRSDCTAKNVNVYDMALIQGIPLIIKTCITD